MNLPRSSVGAMVFGALDSVAGSAHFPNYRALLDDVCDAEPPAYAQSNFGDVFRLRGRDASWIASLLASDSYMEGYSAGRLWQYASSLSDPILANSIRRHARDEAKHSRMFTASVFKTFPTLDDPALRASLESNSPDLENLETGRHLLDEPTDEELLNSMMLINLYEIKALVLCKLTKPVVIAHAAEESGRSLGQLFSAIEEDECRHISYSARYIEQAVDRFGSNYLRESLISFQNSLNRITRDELHEDPTAAATLMGF